MAKKADPLEVLKKKARSYPDVVEGASCTQTSFKVGKSAFFYCGEQGGRYKAMFKLKSSMAEAKKLAKSDPDDYQVGKTAWVTARFSADDPLPKKTWEKWLKESYELSA